MGATTILQQVGLGYLGRPDLTAARFVDHPRLGRLFRTGDIATAGPRGWELVGRRDSQVGSPLPPPPRKLSDLKSSRLALHSVVYIFFSYCNDKLIIFLVLKPNKISEVRNPQTIKSWMWLATRTRR